MKYYSQYNQDKLVNWLLNKNHGFFLDIGANDGISYSNSYFFEKFKNWEGICVEPIKETFQNLQNCRSCICLNIGVWNENKKLKFYKATGYAEMLSGIVQSYDDKHFQRLRKEVESSGGKLETIDIDVRPIKAVLSDYQIHVVDFCSIDTEGSEFEIVESFDFENCKVKIFAIENNYNSEKTHNLLIDKGYIRLIKLGSDDIYILNECFSNFGIKTRFFLFKIWMRANKYF